MATDTNATLDELAAIKATMNFLQATLMETQKSLVETRYIQAVQYLLNHYIALHDDACFDPKKRAELESLFCKDGVAVYSYGEHAGREGKEGWAVGGVSYFESCQLLSANFDIEFSPLRDRAHVRTNCIAQRIKRKEIFSDHFDEG
jgi:hypothetical protein